MIESKGGKLITLYGNAKSEVKKLIDKFDINYLATNKDRTSEYAKDRVDREVERLINYALQKTIKVIRTNQAGLDNIASLLIERTSIDATDLESLTIKY